ncbi:MAG: DUF6765 family protein [Nanoarchaeota archaeon]
MAKYITEVIFMQRDFHHTVIYVLCRLAGMKSKFAEIVAYCSLQVDHASFDQALKFKDGDSFWQTRTAHHKLSSRIFDVSDAFDVWLPFHFLPRGGKKCPSLGLVTHPEGASLKLLKEDVIGQGATELGLYRLGIFLHVYADSFAHQDFKGYYDEYNNIVLLAGRKLKSKRRLFWEKLLQSLSFLAPIGHGQALQNPDIPFAHWSYCRPGGKEIAVNNLEERFIPAVDRIYDFLVDFLAANPRYYGVPPKNSFAENREKVIALLKVGGSSFGRHHMWMERIGENYFNFHDFDQIDAGLDYGRREWFKNAVSTVRCSGLKRVETLTYNFYEFEKRAGFADSNWVKFMRAAGQHRYRVLREILPSCGLDIA